MSEICMQCPRRCAVDRTHRLGVCGVASGFRVARAARHDWEEPVISGTRGSGTIFFAGCNLRCVFCQNHAISHLTHGRDLTDDALMSVMLRLQDEGVHNINLVTPTHYAVRLASVLERVKPRLRIPVVYNSGGYESVATLRRLEGLVDVWLPDFKYYSADLSARYSAAADYCTVATAALEEMLRQAPTAVYDGEGMLVHGVIVRHLVLPGCRADSIRVLEWLAERFGPDAFLLSLMNQYTPEFAQNAPDRNLHRRVTTFEYQSVLDRARSLGFGGFLQDRASATPAYTPDFMEQSL